MYFIFIFLVERLVILKYYYSKSKPCQIYMISLTRLAQVFDLRPCNIHISKGHDTRYTPEIIHSLVIDIL